MPLSEIASTGFASSAAYDANRPGYPAEAVSEFLKVLNIQASSGAHVVDLAAGTGKFTEILAAQSEKFNITAVEPHAGMREQLVSKQLANVKAIDGSAEDMSGVKDSSAAAVIAAQALHWFSNMEALKEIHRVLEPTGVFGAIWNIEDYNAPKGWTIHPGWETKMRDVMWDLDDGLPRFRNEQWKKVFEEQTASNPISIHVSDPLFGLPIGEDSMEVTYWLSKQEILDRFKTYSQVANLDPERLRRFEETFWNAINAPDTEANDQGQVAIHNRVFWAWASKIPDGPLEPGGNPDARQAN